MKTLRRRWRLVLGIFVVIVAIAVSQFVSNPGIQAGVILLAVFIVIALLISGNRRGGGGVQPWHTSSGSGSGGAM